MINLKELLKRRELFDAYTLGNGLDLYTCPGCGYPSLSDRGTYEICAVCNWEDDGQDNAQADEVLGGPNAGLSLTENRILIAKKLQEIAKALGGELNLNPKEIVTAIRNHKTRMNAFDDSKIKNALKGDTVWIEWEKQNKIILTDLIKS